jgi:hypothetical protein
VLNEHERQPGVRGQTGEQRLERFQSASRGTDADYRSVHVRFRLFFGGFGCEAKNTSKSRQETPAGHLILWELLPYVARICLLFQPASQENSFPVTMQSCAPDSLCFL